MSEAERIDAYAVSLGLAPGRVKLIAVNEMDRLIDCAVIFVLARWSGQCKAFYPQFLQAVAAAQNFETPIYIVDADDPAILKLYDHYGNSSSGYGESFWIKHGKLILFHEGFHGSVENVVPITSLVEQYDAL